MEVISTTGSLMINHSGSSETLLSLLTMLLRSMKMMIQTIFVLMMQRILSIMSGVKVSGQEKTQ